MHLIQVRDSDDAVLFEVGYQDRDVAFETFERTVAAAQRGNDKYPDEIVIAMSEDGRVHRRHRVTRREKKADAETREAPATASGVRERAGTEADDAGREEPVRESAVRGEATGRATKAADPVPKRTRRNQGH